MSKLKSLDEYKKNAGMHIAIGRIKGIPEGMKTGCISSCNLTGTVSKRINRTRPIVQFQGTPLIV